MDKQAHAINIPGRMVDTREAAGAPIERKQASALGDLLHFACSYALDGLYHVDAGLRRRRAVIAADEALHDAEKHVAREAREDWPALRRRLSILDSVLNGLNGLGTLDIGLIGLGLRRDYATAGERRTAQRRRKARRQKNRRSKPC